ncbi:MAG TPA: RNA polymerase sigma factor [Steroidobacteraceae bacterium]|nr:RNA polymerase sigma factor [Steroidobacteraceae bacterium]
MTDHAIDDLLREQIPRLRRFAYWLTRDPEDADDLVQSTLERALSRWESRRDATALKPWLFSILYRNFLSTRRRSRRYASMLERFTRGQPEEHPSAEREAAAQSSLEALQTLSSEQRSLLLWVSVEGLSYQEVAQILDIPMGTVMSRLSRARRALRRVLEGEIRTPILRVLK